MKMARIKIFFPFCCTAFLCMFGHSPAFSIDSLYADEVVQQADEISASIMSPYCPELLLRDCPSGKASDLKERIRQDLSLGKSRDQIIHELNAQYGDLSASPSMNGFGQFAWTAPLLFLLGGVVFLIRWLSRTSMAGGK